MYPNKILAVVVTYNRLELLKRCIKGLQAQTLKDFDILIVNNGSTDGTKEWIDSLPEDILRIHQGNLGGAGGFYAGQKYGYENGYEWIWMMDDDGVPDKCQLAELMKATEKYNEKIVAPVVVNVDKPDEEAFRPGEKLALPKGDITYSLNFFVPFNGVIYNRAVMEQIGFVKKELFIYGDEHDYTRRGEVAGFRVCVVLKAKHFHPVIKTNYYKVFPWSDKYQVALKSAKLSKYYYRNNGYLNRTYSNWKVIIVEGLLYSFYFMRKFDLKELSKFLKYYTKGVLQIFD